MDEEFDHLFEILHCFELVQKTVLRMCQEMKSCENQKKRPFVSSFVLLKV